MFLNNNIAKPQAYVHFLYVLIMLVVSVYVDQWMQIGSVSLNM